MNADPRRPDKVQRYAPSKNSANGEDLTPDYMNIMGQPPTTANAVGETVEKHPEMNIESNHHSRPDEVQQVNDELTVTSNAANVIPTSPQYGVAIIPNNITVTANDLTSQSVALPTDTLTESVAKSGDEVKDMHTTPSRNDRFKVVKIASLEPFKRGRWKCMDYVDEAPPPNVANAAKAAQSVGTNPIPGGVYLQTQSLPQQQIQQMLIQGGFTNGTQFFQNVPTQLIPQGQYYYPQVANVQSQTVPQQVAGTMQTQFINNQPYFTAGVVTNPAGFTLPQSYPNIQYVPIPAQGSAFVPTSQAVHLPANFQQSQSYAGQPTTVSQANLNQNMVNGHAFPQQTEPQVQNSNMPNQATKNVIVVNSQPVVTTQPQRVAQNPTAQSNSVIQQQQQFQQQPQSGNFQQPHSAAATQSVAPTVVATPSVIAPVLGISQQPQQGFDASNMYTNPQFAMSVNSLTVLNSNDNPDVKETSSVVETASDNSEDPNKNNPVVNAIDNKIEQAMDLVKSHLMYTVREEVEVLKEKIAELMEKIQQLETENNFLRAQIPKNQSGTASMTAASTTFNQPVPQPQPQNIAIVNPNPSVISQGSNPMLNNGNVPGANGAPNQSQTIPNSSAVQQTATANEPPGTNIQ